MEEKKIEVTETEALQLWAALQRADGFFLARDQMNAHVHMSSTRLSPLTVVVRDAAFLADAIRLRGAK